MARPDHQLPLILLNAAHTVTGGVLIYLQSIVRELGRWHDFRWILLAPKPTLDVVDVPPSWEAVASPQLPFFALHLWEQVALPILARRRGVTATLCNASYVPFIAPSPIPIIHAPASEGLAQATTWSDRLYWRTLELVIGLSLRRSPYTLAVARHLTHSLKVGRGLIDQDRIFFVPPGAPPLPSPPDVRDPNLIVALGDIYTHKQYDIVIEAMAILTRRRPQTRLEIIGNAVERVHAERLARLVGELGLTNHVTLKGAMPHGQLLRRLAQASALVSASLAEAANIVVVEAMALGTPVILADKQFQREMAGDVGIFIAPGPDAPQAYANALFELLEDNPRQHRLHEASQRWAQRFNWSDTASTIITVLRRVIQDNIRAQPDRIAPRA